MAKRVSAAKKESILADLRARVMSRNAIAQKHRVAPSTVARLAEAAGLAAFPGANAAAQRGPNPRDRAAQIALDTALEALTELRNRLADLTGRELISLYTAGIDKHLALAGGAAPDKDAAQSLLEALAEQLHTDDVSAAPALPEAAPGDP